MTNNLIYIAVTCGCGWETTVELNNNPVKVQCQGCGEDIILRKGFADILQAADHFKLREDFAELLKAGGDVVDWCPPDYDDKPLIKTLRDLVHSLRGEGGA